MIKLSSLSVVATMAAATCFSTAAFASPFNLFSFPFQPAERSAPVAPERALAYQSPSYQTPGVEDSTDLPARFKRQMVEYRTNKTPSTIVIETSNTYLYLVLGNGRAIRYGIGVGRDGFTWSGTQTVTRMAEWPDWTPPQEMIERQPYLMRWMAGGEGNPLGARAIYLGSTVYRIHGTNAPETIGTRVSSGCIRMLNTDVIDLYSRVNVGTKILVLPNQNNVAAALRQ